MNASFASRARAASSSRSASASSFSRRARSASAAAGSALPRPDDGLGGPGDHGQAARRAGDPVQGLARRVPAQRPRPGQPLQRRAAAPRAPRPAPAPRTRRAAARRQAPASRRPGRCGPPGPARPARPPGASAASSRSPAAGQRATISSSGSASRVRQRRPQPLGDERHHRVEQPQVRVQRLDERPPGRLALRGGEPLVGQADLGQLDAPVAVLAPDRLVQDPRHLAEAVVGHRAVDRRDRARRRGTGPSARRVRGARGPAPAGAASAGIDGRARAEHEPGRVPELVAEVAGVLDLRRAEPLVVAGRRPVDHREAQRVGADLVDRPERDRRCSPSSSTSSGRTGPGSGPTGRRSGTGASPSQLDAQHHHPGDPEEDDVVAGLHDRARVEPARGRRSRRASRAWRTATARS